MKAIIQRVSHASCKVDGEFTGQIKDGFMVLLGVGKDDTDEQAKLLASKTANLRIFCDENDKMNLSLLDIQGEALVISNFTLCADTKKGNRPSFINAKEPEAANTLYELFCEELKNCGVQRVEKGIFGADMKVELLNDGPVTIILDTDIWRK
ncbi:MAG: D-aminoacyl-tRNA deacylase [Acutalibacteraceae bacterium]|nr:D-aminoacyl-tRNA deacylase [Acutalibacteraceae bacterium]